MKKYKKLDLNTEDLENLSNSDLKKVADYWLRQYLLRREGNLKYLHCPLKNKSYPIENMQVAHFIDRGIMNTRYDLCNCHLISKQSNEWDAQVQKEGYKSLHHNKDLFSFLIFIIYQWVKILHVSKNKRRKRYIVKKLK